jgi:membrane-associated phospholipid phosphatase
MKINYIVFCLLNFLIGSFNISFAQNFDIHTLKEINVHRNTSLDDPMKFISNTEGYIGVGLPLSVAAIGLLEHDKKLVDKGVNMATALAFASVQTYVLKRVINRDRPSVTYPFIQAFENERHYSFPSGHTSNAFVTATSLSLNLKKWYIILPSFTWACAVGYSRMHLGMHYPSDVAAGALLGAGSAWVTYKANRLIKAYYMKRYFNKEHP